MNETENRIKAFVAWLKKKHPEDKISREEFFAWLDYAGQLAQDNGEQYFAEAWLDYLQEVT